MDLSEEWRTHVNRKEMIKRIFHRLWSVEKTLFLYKKENIVPQKTPLFEGVFFRCKTEDSDCTASFEDAGYYAPIYRKMIEKGDWVVLGVLEQECVFRCCVQLCGDINFDGCVVRSLQKQEAYIHYVYCSPEHRGKGFHKECLRWIASQLPGYRFWAQVQEKNIPSMKGFKENGFAVYSELTSYNRLGKRWIREKRKEEK